MSLKKCEETGQSVVPKKLPVCLPGEFRNGLNERLVVKKPFFRKGNWEKRLRYVNLTQEVQQKSAETDLGTHFHSEF